MMSVARVRVHFNMADNRVHVMTVWSFAHRVARIGVWEHAVCDRARFQRRVAELSKVISPVLHESHRDIIKERNKA
jgi:hypothetical protein